jgi:hypothetical protein
MIRREKVKDIVEIRAFTHLSDFAADPGLTIASYRFTDVTSDLMGKWIDAIANVRSGYGRALALAGLRGVGKSHFIAVLAALVTKPELRPRANDPHILSSLDRLPKRILPVAVVRRGSGNTLMSELRAALAQALSINQKDLSDSLNDVLINSSKIAGDSSLLIFVDTAFGREARVNRDDGPMLSQVAEAATNLGIFVGIALDDDVSGADGPNSSIARAFQIDFLDQEHLYKIVDRHIFPKNDSMLPVLKDIYSTYQLEVPGFRWSEQRFLPLYPMHPATLEISPLIRLFIQDFALLGFASEAGVKIMGRPANSLIGLDEIFSNVETRLRKDPQLQSAFRSFDKLDQEVVQKSPVQFRLKAKLILKGLFLLSLDGRGASASSIAAAMMVFDDHDPDSTLDQVQNLLDSFAAAFPMAVSRSTGEGSLPRYCLKIGINDDLEEELRGLTPDISNEQIREALLSQISEKFPEIESADGRLNPSYVTVEWRGSMRRGRIFWHKNEVVDSTGVMSAVDWKVELLDREEITDNDMTLDSFICRWVAESPTEDEAATVAQFVVMKQNQELRHRFGEGYATKLQLLSASVQKISQRLFFAEAALQLGDRNFPFVTVPDTTHNLSQLFSTALSPVFEHLYPQHPYFLEPLGEQEVSHLTANFFGRADSFSPTTQNLAQLFGEPLGLAEINSDGYVPASSDQLALLPFVKSTIGDWKGSENLDLSIVAKRFKSAPFGLTQEAQQLVLTALVAQRAIEFVTTTGNRINHRSLDLQVIWEDVIGLSRPRGEKYSNTELLSWFRKLTGEESIDSLDGSDSDTKITGALEKWLTQWTSGKTLEDYYSLHDQSLNAESWRKSNSIRKTLGSVADIVHSRSTGAASVRECLASVADLFLGSEAEFDKKSDELRSLENFTARARQFQMVSNYLSDSELTGNKQVERARQNLINSIETFSSGNLELDEILFSAWERFRLLYSDFYIRQHNNVSNLDRTGALRNLSASRKWQQFEMHSLLSVSDRHANEKVRNLIREYSSIPCQFSPAQCLELVPYCFCGLRISDARRTLDIPDQIITALESENSTPSEGLA